jgi:aryl-alcohol dehydrogenase-like predicted oxidoreductase
VEEQLMEYSSFGSADIKVSRIGLGTWSVGGWMWGGTEEAVAVKAIKSALESGINFIDTAPVYGFGQSEKIVGEALKQTPRDKVVLATKVGIEWQPDGKLFRNSSAARINKEVEDSLRRLNTDYIDLYQVHWPDLQTPFDEAAQALESLKQAGKVRAVGLSNYSPGEIERFRIKCPVASNQPPYNLFEREIEKDVLPYCRKNNIAVIAYGALCRGLLSGRMSEATVFEGDDLRKIDPKFARPRYGQYLQAVKQLDEYALLNFNRGVLHLAVRWLLDQPGVTVALWGARKPEQLDVIEECFGWTVDSNHQKAIDEILKATIKDPVGPEFMAPPLERPLSVSH